MRKMGIISLVAVLLCSFLPNGFTSKKSSFAFPALPTSHLFERYEGEFLRIDTVKELNNMFYYTPRWQSKGSVDIWKNYSDLPSIVALNGPEKFITTGKDTEIWPMENDSFLLVKRNETQNKYEIVLSKYRGGEIEWSRNLSEIAGTKDNITIYNLSEKLVYFNVGNKTFFFSIETGLLLKIYEGYLSFIRFRNDVAILFGSKRYFFDLCTLSVMWELPDSRFARCSNDRILFCKKMDNTSEKNPFKYSLHDLWTGKLLKEFTLGDLEFMPGYTPQIPPDNAACVGDIFVSACVKPRFGGNAFIFGYDITNKKLLFIKDVECAMYLVVRCDDDYIYYRNNAGITCLDPKNGNVVWRVPTFFILGSIKIANDRLTLNRGFFDEDGSVKEGLFEYKEGAWEFLGKASYNESIGFSFGIHLIKQGILHVPYNRKGPIELIDLETGKKIFSLKLPTWESSISNPVFTLQDKALYVSCDPMGLYEISLTTGEYDYYQLRIKTPVKDSCLFNRIASSDKYVCAIIWMDKWAAFNRKTKTLKIIYEGWIQDYYTFPVVRGDYLYCVGIKDVQRISILDGSIKKMPVCVFDVSGNIIFSNGDVVDLEGNLILGAYGNNKFYETTEFCVDNCQIVDDMAVALNSGKTVQRFEAKGGHMQYLCDSKSLYRWDKLGFIKYEPCPTFSIENLGTANGKIRFKIAMTRDDGLSQPLSGKIYFVPMQMNDMIKLGNAAFEVSDLRFGQERIFEFDIPDGTQSDETFVLTVESNGLLDTEKSNLDKTFYKKQIAFEGIPISYSQQQSLVTTLWKY